MLDKLRAMAVFAKTVETRSFRAAAKVLGLSPSVVSHHVAQLEAQLGVVLLHRTTRTLTVTAEGKRLFDAAQEMLAAAAEGLGEVTMNADNPSGNLSVTAPAGLVSSALTEHVAAFAKAYPNVLLTLHFSDAPLDLVREGIDVAIRGGQLKDSSFKSRKLFELVRRTIASPSYMNGRPTPHVPADVAGWDWIRLKSRPSNATFLSRARREQIDFSARVATDNSGAMLALARHGLGLAIVPEALARDDLAAGRVVEVLPEWRPESPNMYAVWPANAPRAGLSALFVAFLEERLRRAD